VLYKPIIRAMDEREQKIAVRLEEAEQKRQDAENEAQNYREKTREIDEERQAILNEAREEVEEKRGNMLDDARHEVEQARKNWHESIEREKQAFLRDLRERIQEQAFQVIRRALTDLADAELEAQMVRRFVARLRDSEAQALSEVLQNADRDVVIYSAFELPETGRNEIISTLERFGDDFDMVFKIDPRTISGLTLASADYQISWNLDDYLTALEQNVRETLAAEAGEQTRKHERETA